MPISVNTNVGALASMAASTSTSKALDTALTRLATGKRINTAGDDAAGIAISARLTSEVKGLGMAIKNALDGQGLIDTTEGAQAEVTNILQRMRELAVKAANDTNSASDRKNIDAEIQQLVIEVDRISSTTTWAGQKILHGANGLDVGAKTLSFQVGFMDEDSQKINVSVLSTSSKSLDISATDKVVTLVSTPPSTGATNVNAIIAADGSIALEQPSLPATLPATVATGVTFMRDSNTSIRFTAPVGSSGAGTNTLLLNGYSVQVPLADADATTAIATKYTTAINNAVAAGDLPVWLKATAELPSLPTTIGATVATGVTFTRDSNTAITFTGAVGSTGAGTNTLLLNGYSVQVPLANSDATTAIATKYAAAINSAVTAGNLPIWFTATATAGSSTVSFNGSTVNLTRNNPADGSLEMTLNGIKVAVDVETPSLPTTFTNTSTVVSGGTAVARASGTSFTVTSAAAAAGAGTISFKLGEKDVSVAIANNEAASSIASKIKNAIEANSSGLTATVSGTGSYTVSFVQSDATILGNLSNAIRAAKVPGVFMTESTTTPGTYSIDKHVFGATTAEAALSALTRIDNAITAVNDQRSALGAISNRLSYTVNNLTNIVTNLDMSRGRIEDADFALESANMARFQILQQASTAMLAQANAAKQDVLSLIK